MVRAIALDCHNRKCGAAARAKMIEEVGEAAERDIAGGPIEHEQARVLAAGRRFLRDPLGWELEIEFGSLQKRRPWSRTSFGGVPPRPRWEYASGVATRPRCVRLRKPSMIRNGS